MTPPKKSSDENPSAIPIRRSKSSIIRSSSTGSYPYPRTHTTLMVIPSNRPPPTPQSQNVSNKIFTGIRRRPPLNRACPPIPESKSNESIMSHASRVSEKQQKASSDVQVEDLVIENRNVVDVLHRLDSNSNIATKICSEKEKRAKKMSSSTPRSPLMNVAHSVKNKLTKITNIGRSSDRSSSSRSIKTSQSFSGIRQPKSVPKRIDQNANRVIKSSSMDVSQPSTSKITIPQNPLPLADNKIEEISEAGLIPKSEIATLTVSSQSETKEEKETEKVMDHKIVSVELEEDVLVVTKEFDQKYPGQKRSASPDPPSTHTEEQEKSEEIQEPTKIEVFRKEVVETFDANANPKTPGVVRRVITTTTTTTTTTTSVSPENNDAISRVEPESPILDELSVVREKEENLEEVTSPERYVMLVKTPEALRKERVLTIGEADPETKLEDQKCEHISREKVKIQKDRASSSKSPEQMISPERYVMMVKTRTTPEALRKERTLTIGLKEAAPAVELEEKIHYTKLETVKFAEIDSPPEPEPKPEKFILTVKTPEALRRHHTFTIRDKSPEEMLEQAQKEENEKLLKKITKSKSDVQVKGRNKPEKGRLVKQMSEPERMISPERFILVVKTPEALRKHRTLTIGDREKTEDPMKTHDQEEVMEARALGKLAAKKNCKIMRRSESETRERKPERMELTEGGTKYVMVMKTPEALRRHHTFTIGPRPKSPDYPYIEEGEITEPIATVGPPAERRKKEEKKEKKRKEWEEYEKPKEPNKYILTTTTPIAMRKYQTFVVEPKVEEQLLPTSASADAVVCGGKTKKGKIQRSESTDSKKHSYLRRLQFELFRGRSRERKNDKEEKRQKSLDERKPESTQKYILSTTTPVMMRKYQTFAIVDGDKNTQPSTHGKIDKNLESIAASYQRDKSFDDEKHSMSPIRTSDFYSITATTPIAKRKNMTTSDSNTSSSGRMMTSASVALGSSSDEKNEKNEKNEKLEHPDHVSPEPRLLFVMGGRRSTTPKEERRSRIETPPRHLKLEMDLQSQSDHAERKSTRSGDLTSPEEEIPMDTNLTPTTDDIIEVAIVSRRIEGLMTSPIEEEPEGLTSSIRDVSIRSEKVSMQRAAPVFTPPSPPPVMTMPKSTSTSSSDSSSTSRKPTQLPLKKMIEIDPMHIVELKPSTNSREKTKSSSKSSQIGAKSLRNAGKMLTPSFLRKDRKNDKKKAYVKTTTMGREHVMEKMERKAPLAERESTQIANSPLVENLPITFEKWSSKSPRQGVKRFSETIDEEGSGLDTNANLSSSQLEPTSAQSLSALHHQHNHHHQHQDTGLIDDDILDQPMLVGDTFSHSSSIDCISQHQSKMNESIISIDRSIAHDTRSNTTRTQEIPVQNPNLTKQIDAGLVEVEDIKSQLQRLNKIVNEIGISGWEDELIRLRRENAQLRGELAEKDATIAALRSQTVSS